MIQHNGKDYVCFVDLGMEIIKGKWKGVILCRLKSGPKRFLQLHRITTGVSQKVLTEKLNELERDGLIHKIVYDEMPPRVEYELSQLGLELYPAIEILKTWTEKHIPVTMK